MPAPETARHSLRLRLPLLMSSLIAVVLTTFLYAAYRQVEHSLEESGGSRAQATADELASLLVQSAQQRLAELQRAARDPVLVSFLENPGDAAATDKARQRLATLAAPGQPPVEVFNATGVRVLSVNGPSRPGTPPPRLPDQAAPAPGVSPFQIAHGILFWGTSAAVTGAPRAAPDAAASPARLGVVSSRRYLSGSASAELGRLVGSGAVLKIGNQDGDVWTDLAKAVPGPQIDPHKAGVAQFTGPDGQPRLGAIALIRGTPWAAWVEFPRALVIAPARVFLMRMIVVALFFVVAAGVVALELSGRITTPLHELTQAAEAIAQGRYLEPVHSGRRDEIGRLGTAFNVMAAEVRESQRALEGRVEARVAEITAARKELEQRVAELDTLSRELEAFSYSVSHDLRAPLRHVAGFAALLEKSAGPSLDEQGRRYVRTIADAASRMGRLIDDLLVFSRMGRAEMLRTNVHLTALVEDVRHEAVAEAKDRHVEWTVHPLPVVQGDPSMLRLVLTNLVSNALKYTSTRASAEIEIGCTEADGETQLFVRDNGVGFDMAHAHKLFGVFQRLHTVEEFDGTGIGLANVRRIISRHGGRTWAEGTVDHGATFYVSLPSQPAVV